MRRTQVYLEEALDARLRAVARAQGCSAAALVRAAVAAYLTDMRTPEVEAGDPLAGLVGAFEGAHRDAAERHDWYLYGRARGRRP